MTPQILYASGLICYAVCSDCPDKPCPYRNWLAKNDCPKIIEYNEQLGQCCATCCHLVANQYCAELARGKKITPATDFREYLINDDVFKHSCDKWTNIYKE